MTFCTNGITSVFFKKRCFHFKVCSLATKTKDYTETNNNFFNILSKIIIELIKRYNYLKDEY